MEGRTDPTETVTPGENTKTPHYRPAGQREGCYGFAKSTAKKDISTHFFKIDFFNSFHLIRLFAVSKLSLIWAARTSAIHGDSADFQKYLLVRGGPTSAPVPARSLLQPPLKPASSPRHHAGHFLPVLSINKTKQG